MITVAYYAILRNIRDWKYLTLLIAAPIFTILITGFASDHIDTTRMLEKVKVLYFAENTGATAKIFEDFIAGPKVVEAFEFSKTASKAEGLEKVKGGKVEALILVGDPQVQVYSAKEKSSVQSLMESFTLSFSAGKAAAALGGEATGSQSSGGVAETALSATGTAPSGLDRWTYFNTMIFLFYGAIMSGLTVINDYRKNTILRLSSAPMHKMTDTAGKILGHVVTLFGCAVVIILFTNYAFHSNWKGNPGIILLTYLLFCIITVCTGILVGRLTKRLALTVIIVFMVDVLLFNASDMGFSTGSGGIPVVSAFSPFYHGGRALINEIFNGPAQRVWDSICALAGGSAVLLGLSLIVGRRRVQ